MIIHREIRSSYHHKPKVQGVDYSPFIMVMMVEMLEKMETTPAAPRRSFPPPICSSRSSVSWFCVSAALPFESRRGTIFIVVFRSRRRLGKKDRRQRSHEAPDGGSHAAKESGRLGHPLLVLGPPFVRFLRSHASFLPKTDARKFPGHLDVVWVPETSKYRK